LRARPVGGLERAGFVNLFDALGDDDFRRIEQAIDALYALVGDRS
jgi:hypothetical protein